MSSEFDTGLPSTRFIQQFIIKGRESGQSLDVKLITGDHFSGVVSWQDNIAICLDEGNGKPIVIYRNAIAFLRESE